MCSIAQGYYEVVRMRAVNINERGKVKLTDSPCIINRSVLNFLHSGPSYQRTQMTLV